MTMSSWWIPYLSTFLLLDFSFVLNTCLLSILDEGGTHFFYENIVCYNVAAKVR